MAKLYYRHSSDEKEALRYAILEYKNALSQGVAVLLSSPEMPYSDESFIRDINGEVIEFVKAGELRFLDGDKLDGLSVIIVANAHLCAETDAEYIIHICESKNITVVCYGKRVDDTGHAYAGASAILPFADEIERIEPEPDFDEEIDPMLMEFLDASSYEKKLEIFARMNNIDDDMINTMAISLDIEVRPGSIDERKAEIKKCLMTMEKYECTRLR